MSGHLKREAQDDPVVMPSPNSKNGEAKDNLTITPGPVSKKPKHSPYAMDSAASNAPTVIPDAYRGLMPNNVEGVAFLHGSRLYDSLQEVVGHVAVRYRTTMELAFEEFRRLIAIKAYVVDTNADKISPTPLMDEIWHAAILDTRFYRELQAALGMTLHHRPEGAGKEEDQQREVRLKVMKAIYHMFFSGNPLAAGPYSYAQAPQGRISIRVQILGGKLWDLEVERDDSIERLKVIMRDKAFIPVEQQKMLLNCKYLEDSRTIKDYGITQGAVIHLILPLKGC